MNSFFASCEQQDRPELRRKPIAIVPMFADSTSVLAASYEAKKFGIKTGTKVYEAKKLCPKIQFICTSHRKYVEYHHKVIAAIDEICPVEKVLSIDEMACRLIGRERHIEQALDIARRIKTNILEKVGECLTTSVGIGPNVMIAKIASDMMKPDGLISIEDHQIQEKIGKLPIEVIPGVGRKMKYNMNSKGFYCISDLLAVSDQELRSKWGSIVGLKLAQELRGLDFNSLKKETQSYSHEHVLPPHLRNHQGAFNILLKLASKGAQRLRKSKRKASAFGLSIRFRSGEYFEKSIQISPTDDTVFFVQQLKTMYPSQIKGIPIKTNVVFSQLSDPHTEQLSFFTDPKQDKLNQIVDSINQKFGSNSIMAGGVFNVTSEAKSRISFQHIPDLKEEFE